MNTHIKKLLIPAVVMSAFWGIGAWGWAATGYVQPLFMFGYIGSSVGLGLGLYAVLPKKHKPKGRRLALFMVGAFLFAFAVFVGRENSQVEGFFFGLLTGVIQMAVIHYFIAKIVGPLLFGRLWCGWACWTVMVLDLLPFTRPSGRLPGRWGWLRYLHFGVSLALVLVLFLVFGYREGVTGPQAVIWFLAGNLAYYAVGVSMAYTLEDNRAFCKYLCPVAVPLKLTSRFSLLKIGGVAENCNDCDACEKMCPMDVRISDYILNGDRVLTTECSLARPASPCAPETRSNFPSVSTSVGRIFYVRECRLAVRPSPLRINHGPLRRLCRKLRPVFRPVRRVRPSNGCLLPPDLRPERR